MTKTKITLETFFSQCPSLEITTFKHLSSPLYRGTLRAKNWKGSRLFRQQITAKAKKKYSSPCFVAQKVIHAQPKWGWLWWQCSRTSTNPGPKGCEDLWFVVGQPDGATTPRGWHAEVRWWWIVWSVSKGAKEMNSEIF